MNFLRAIYRIISKVIFIILLAIFITFCINNTQDVLILFDPLTFEISIKLFLLIIITFLIGAIIGFLLSCEGLLRVNIKNLINKFQIKSLRKRKKDVNNS
jgi:uncharacterized membrane protein YciS (DUF1049 family)